MSFVSGVAGPFPFISCFQSCRGDVRAFGFQLCQLPCSRAAALLIRHDLGLQLRCWQRGWQGRDEETWSARPKQQKQHTHADMMTFASSSSRLAASFPSAPDRPCPSLPLTFLRNLLGGKGANLAEAVHTSVQSVSVALRARNQCISLYLQRELARISHSPCDEPELAKPDVRGQCLPSFSPKASPVRTVTALRKPRVPKLSQPAPAALDGLHWASCSAWLHPDHGGRQGRLVSACI